jgi:hypothetical protein
VGVGALPGGAEEGMALDPLVGVDGDDAEEGASPEAPAPVRQGALFQLNMVTLTSVIFMLVSLAIGDPRNPGRRPISSAGPERRQVES